MIFVTSDLHFNHDKNFIYEPRGFSCINDHDQGLIYRWNQTVQPLDEVYFLGDIGMGKDIDYLVSCVQRLNGTIHWIRGNHDSDKRWAAIGQLPHIIQEERAMILKYNDWRFYLNHYPVLSAPIGEKTPHKSRISLCGHTHTTDKFLDWGRNYKECGSCASYPGYMIYHVELDAHNNYPVSLEQIIEDIQNIYNPV